MIKVLAIFGTRPEAIKMAPLVNHLKERKNEIEVKVCVTAQHREMLDMVLDIFSIEPDYDLNIMEKNQTLIDINKKVLDGVDEVLKIEKPDIVLVHGDTSTALSSAMTSFYNKIPVGHIEAGLRSGSIYSPFPEEFNRKLIGSISTLHFAPTEKNRENLLKEGVSEEKIFVTGNTVIDALKTVVKSNFRFGNKILDAIDYKNKKVILLTVHRRENWGEPMEKIFKGIKMCVKNNKDCSVIFPMHQNPIVRECAKKYLEGIENIHLIDSLDYMSFSNLMNKAYFIVTDSGGIQEEAPALGKPVIVLRKETERMEGIEAGTVKLCDISKESIAIELENLLKNEKVYKKMSEAINPYGVGDSSKKIGDILIKYVK